MKLKQYLFTLPIFVSAFITISALLVGQRVHAQGIKFKFESFIAPGTIEELLLAILNVFIVVATPIVVLFIVYAGFLYVTAQGNVQQVQQATRALTYSIIGGIFIIGAVAIAGIISGIVSSLSAP